MISLEVEKYCENCNEFKPCAIVNESGFLNQCPRFDTVIICEQAERCQALMEHLKRCDAQ